MKISRRSFLKVAGAAGVASALAACGGSSASSTAASSAAASGSTAAAADGDVTIRMTWWGGQTRHDLTQKVLDK